MIDFDPHLEYTLSDCTGTVEQITVLDWLLLDGLPSLAKVPIIQVKYCLSNQIIAKEVIIVICKDFNRWRSGKIDDEVVTLVELGI